MESSLKRRPIRIAVIYFIVSSLYIVLSDRLFSFLFPTLEDLAIAQTFKGLGFIMITSIILFIEVRKLIADIMRERKKTDLARQAQEQSESNYRNMANYSPFAKFVILDGKIVYLNEACLALLGVISPKEVLGKSSQDFFHPDSHKAIKEHMAVMTQIGQSIEPVEEKLIRPDGKVIDVEVSASLFPYQKRNAVHVILRDISDAVAARQKIEMQLQQLRASHEINLAILNNPDHPTVLDICLEQVVDVLAVDGADIVLWDAEEIGIDPYHSQGIASQIEAKNGSLARDLRFQKIVRDREQVFIPDLNAPLQESKLPAFLFGEGFNAYCGLPLIAKGNVEGILELYSLSPLNPSVNWFEFLETISSQIALAVQNMLYFESMHHSLVNLEKAYDKTIEGWSKAMDLRDRETEDHAQRITLITLELARRFGFNEEDLRYVRWGAQLHDMGKLGIPDEILLKPGKLTPEEWTVMRRHPQFAFDMLQSIEYLKPALDIPYCHHEKWDGSGYPNGLKSNEIPLAARIFAVVDVWDALSSDRPYRSSWPEERVMDYIQEQAGQHFDPAVVEAFLDFMTHEY
jgi:PAS domain S-box-containing protein